MRYKAKPGVLAERCRASPPAIVGTQAVVRQPPATESARPSRWVSRLSRLPRPVNVAERIERAHVLDQPIRALSGAVVRALPGGARADALHGVPFGQPAHPALVRLPLGCWTSAVLLDVFRFRGSERASRVLVLAGVARPVPAAATGLADWSALHRDQQRVGLVHLGCELVLRLTGSTPSRPPGWCCCWAGGRWPAGWWPASPRVSPG